MADEIVELMNELMGYLNQWSWVPDERKDLSNIDNLKWLYKELVERDRHRRGDDNAPRAMLIIRILVVFMEA
tara:strand:- start:288 stop:503 length:216 start_codon:yes stop_codon:yes gene_type:complete